MTDFMMDVKRGAMGVAIDQILRYVDKDRESSEEIANILRLHEEAQQQVEKDMLQQKLVEQGVDEHEDK